MVQVDVFWAYSLGATLAAASGRQIKAAAEGRLEKDPVHPIRREDTPFITRYFVKALLFLSLIWAPTGMILLLKHPSWETMQVFSGIVSLGEHPFIVLAFGWTNVALGILGYWVTSRLVTKGRFYAAHFQWLIGYFCMFFILLYGWDGLGYDRFLYDRDMFGGAPWTPGAGIAPGAGINFLFSSVAMTLYMDGLFLIPPLYYWFGTWIKEGAERDSSVPREMVPSGIMRSGLLYAGAVFGIALLSAAAAALTVYFIGRFTGHIASYFIGLPLFALVWYFLLLKKGRPVYSYMKSFFFQEDSPSAESAATLNRAAAEQA